MKRFGPTRSRSVAARWRNSWRHQAGSSTVLVKQKFEFDKNKIFVPLISWRRIEESIVEFGDILRERTAALKAQLDGAKDHAF